MELWIRSQDKKRLFKIDNVGINDYNGYFYVVSIIKGEEVKLGKYEFHNSTRALEVLDEIQNKINLINLGHDFGSPMIDLNNPTYIYEMPKE